jgi:hypothetical protein
MLRFTRVPPVGIPLTRALLCPNDDTVYDSARWKSCPTCQNEDRVFLSRMLGSGGGTAGSYRRFARPRLAVNES